MDPITIAALIGAGGSVFSSLIGSNRAPPAAPAGRSEAGQTSKSDFLSTFSNPVNPNNDGSIKSHFSQSFDNSFTVATSGSNASSKMPALSHWLMIGGAAALAFYAFRKYA